MDGFKSKNITIPIDDLIENPEIAGIVVAVLFLGIVFCFYKCCSPAAKKRRRKKHYGNKQAIEFGTRRRAYRDDFDDELDSLDDEYGYSDDQGYSDGFGKGL